MGRRRERPIRSGQFLGKSSLSLGLNFAPLGTCYGENGDERRGGNVAIHDFYSGIRRARI